MRLTLLRPYLSIREFAEIAVPDITVIYGPNGSGKTHLLRAIEEESIVAAINGQPIGSFYANDFKNIDPLQYNHPTIHESYQKGREQILALIQSSDITAKFLQENTTEDQREAFEADRIGLLNEAVAWVAGLNPEIINNLNSLLLDQIRAQLPQFAPQVENFVKFTGLGLHEISPSDLVPDNYYEIPSTLLFPQIGRLFHRYNAYAWSQKKYRIKRDRNYKYDPADPVFLGKYGEPPWQVFNQRLQELGFDFSFDAPLPQSPDKWQFKLKHGANEVSMDRVSAGERVMLSFALATLAKENGSMRVYSPGVLLLDEPDAHLHPALVRDLFQKIIHPIVAAGTKVIMTTHSPTTIALAPEHSIFRKVGGEGIVPTNKQRAIDNLLIGVPHLALDFSGRRQVFTESTNDADYYQDIYDLVRHTIDTDRSLVFIGAGGSEDGGKARVRSLTTQLRQRGNASIFGVIDWDGEEVESDCIYVNGHDLFYSVENLLLNPLYIGLLLIKSRKSASFSEYRFTEAASYTAGRLQDIVSEVERRFSLPESTQRVELSFTGGQSVGLLDHLLKMNGHEYERMVLTSWPELTSMLTTSDKSLKRSIVNHVISELPIFCPNCLREVFQRILLH